MATNIIQHKAIRLAILPFTLLAITTNATAQQPGNDDNERRVVVEMEYAPEISDADKINFLPQAELKTKSSSSEAIYATSANPYGGDLNAAKFKLGYTPTEADKAKRNLVYAGYGNRGSIDAGIYINPSAFNNNEIKFKALFKGINGTRWIDSMDGREDIEWKARHYSTDAALDYVHQFNVLTLYAKGGFELDNFNLRPRLDLLPIDDRGRHTKARAALGIKSKLGRLGYNIFADYSFFDKAFGQSQAIATDNENNIAIGIHGNFEIDSQSSISLKFDAQSYTYSNNTLDDFATFSITPAYTFKYEGLGIKAGMHIDFVTKGSSKAKAAPDIEVAYTFAGNCTLQASAKGGMAENGYRMLEKINPYWNPEFGADGTVKLFDIYKQADIDYSFKVVPTDELEIIVGGGYDINKGDLCLIASQAAALFSPYSEMTQQKTKVIHGKLRAQYSYKGRFTASAALSIMRWNASNTAALALKPRYTIEMRAVAEIIDNLILDAAFISIGRKDKAAAGNINDLSAKLSYTFPISLSVFAKLANITASRNCYYYAYPSQGTTVTAGLAYEF